MDPNPDSKISSGQGAYVPPARFYGTSVEKRKAAELEKPTVKPTPGVMQNKCSTFLPFTSSHKNRIQARTDMYREVTGRIAGPFEFGRFIATFLEPPPPARLPCPWTDEKNGPKFSIVASAPTELQMYDPWIDAMKEFCPRLKIINTSKHAAKTFLDLEIKPDMSKAEIIMEFKHSKNDDPFEEDDKCEQKAFEKTTDLARDTLGQITLYTTAQLASQFRTHAFSVLVFPTYSRLLHWARDGVAVTAKISSKDLAEFFWQFNHSSPAIRGRDTSVSNKLGESLNGSIEESKVWKILKLDEYTPLVRVSLGENNGDYIVGSPTYMAASSPIGRATRSFKALSVATGEPVFLKDSWRIDAKHHKPEHEIYEKLRKAKVPHVATLIEASDILLHKTKLAQLPEGKKLRLRTFIHYRIVLKEIGIDLCSFVNTKELVQVLRDATEAHYHAFKFANVLHGDISAGNIVITPSGRGLLIDWDLCRDLDDINHQQARWEQTGTWQFMAARLLRVASVSGRKLPQPNRTDDHESFLWVLLWVALKHTKHQLPGLPLKNKLYSIFDESHWDVGGVSTGGGALATLFTGLGQLLSVRYDVDPSKRRKINIEEFSSGYDTLLLERYKARTAKLESEHPILDIFELVLSTKSIDWEPHGERVCNEIPVDPDRANSRVARTKTNFIYPTQSHEFGSLFDAVPEEDEGEGIRDDVPNSPKDLLDLEDPSLLPGEDSGWSSAATSSYSH